MVELLDWIKMQYAAQLEICPLAKAPRATVRVPGSKSITNRALVLAAIYTLEEPCQLTDVLRSEDTELMVDALRALGYLVETDWDGAPPTIRVVPTQWAIVPESEWPPCPANLFVGNSGTTMRFLAALASLGEGKFRLDGTARMRERPIEDLLDALRQAGISAYSELGNGCPPVIVEGRRGWYAPHIRVRGDLSSQFLSAVLIVAPMACRKEGVTTIEIEGPLVSRPYIDMTLSVIEQGWALPISRDGACFRVENAGTLGWCENVRSFAIEPDASAASYFFAAAAITSGSITVSGLSIHRRVQGDVRFVDVLEQMGARVSTKHDIDAITVHGGPLHGIDVDMNDISDTVMTLAAVACFAEGPTTIRNVAHIRHKETDRLAALATELRRIGAKVEERADGLTITPAPLHGAIVQTYNDHRMAMSLALVGLKVPGIVIDNPGCVAKTYPRFFEDLERLR